MDREKLEALAYELGEKIRAFQMEYGVVLDGYGTCYECDCITSANTLELAFLDRETYRWSTAEVCGL